MVLESTRLIVEPLQRSHFLIMTQLGLSNRRLQRLDGLIVDADRNEKGRVFLKLCGARLDRLTGGRYSRACEQNQIGPRGQVYKL